MIRKNLRHSGLFSGIKNCTGILPEKEDNTDSFYMFASAFGDRKNVKDTEDDVVYMIKKQKAAGKKISTRIYGNWS